MSSLRFGIVGIGNIGTNHARNFLAGHVRGAELTAICDRDSARLAPFRDVAHFTDAGEMFRSGQVDAVIVACPHFAHVPVGIAALEAGLHVLCEKPLCVHVADGRRLLAAHTDKSLQFGVMFDTRTEPRYRKLRELVQGGELGEIRRISWILSKWFRSEAYFRSSGWRATWAGEGGGMLVNQLPHDLDLFQWIFGLPRRVHAFCGIGKFHDIEVEDEISAHFDMPNGAVAQIYACTGEAPGTDRREIVGDRGRIIVHDDHLAFTRNTVPTPEFNRTTSECFSAPESWEIKIPTPGSATRHVGVIQAFTDAVCEGTPLIACAEEGLASAELANAIIYSSETGRTVELPLDADEYEAFLQKKMADSRFEDTTGESAPVADMSASFN